METLTLTKSLDGKLNRGLDPSFSPLQNGSPQESQGDKNYANIPTII